MRLFYFTLPFAVIFNSCSENTETTNTGHSVSSVVATMPDTTIVSSASDNATGDSLQANAVYTYETFMPGDVEGWGYRILMDGEVYIEQPHIPAVQGNRGFSTPIHAIRTAELAISKIKQGLIPPAITVDELDSLGVLK